MIGSSIPAGTGNFSLHHRVQTCSGAHPASYSMGTGGSFSEGKLPGLETDHSPPSSAEVKNAWSYTSARPLVSMPSVRDAQLKAQGQFYLTFSYWLSNLSIPV
jgi:hypothetical protein